MKRLRLSVFVSHGYLRKEALDCERSYRLQHSVYIILSDVQLKNATVFAQQSLLKSETTITAKRGNSAAEKGVVT